MTTPQLFKAPIRWGIIGCGNVTEIKSGPAYQQTEGFALQAVMRRDFDKARDYAARHKVPDVYRDADALIHAKTVDAVYIATPPDSHAYYALKVAAAGKPCCIEKPMAPSVRECVEIERAFAEKNLPLFVAYYRRCLPRFVKVKQWLDAGAIGKPCFVNLQMNCPAKDIDLSAAPNWRTEAKIAKGGYFDDLASHGLNLLEFLLGKITQVSGISKNLHQLYSANDTTVANWQHSDNILGSGHWNFVSPQQEDRVIIEGSTGYIQFSVFNNAPIILENNEKREELWIEHPAHIQASHVAAMAQTLLNGQQHPSTGLSAVATTAVMDKILEQ